MAYFGRDARNGVRVERRVAAVGEVETPAFFCLCSSCKHVTEVVKTVTLAQLALKIFKQA